MEVIIIIGLPGSGKTYLGKALSKQYNYPFFDDVSLEKTGAMIKMKEAISNKKSFIVADPYLCYVDIQNKLKGMLKGYDVEWIYFENDPQQCLINSAGRENKKVKNLIKQLSKNYYIPDDMNLKEIYKL